MQSVAENNITLGPDITWPKDFPELKSIDDVLRCGICYEYLKTVMVTPCAHSYCSICIRKYLSYKTACPICFEETFESSLRNNRILDRVVELFSHIRDKLIKHLKIAAIHFNCNEKSISSAPCHTPQRSSLPNETPKHSFDKSLSKIPSSKGKLNFSSLSSPSTSAGSRKSEISKRLEDILGSPASNPTTKSNSLDSALYEPVNCEMNIATVPSMFLKDPQPIQAQHRTDVPVVSCPVCFVDIPERNINAHLDNCLANADKPVKSPVKKKLKRTPLPKMVWHMMAEKDLRKKLKDYGLSTNGDKRTLTTRVQRYIVLYNSECDSENPRSVSDIIRQVEREEKQLPTVQFQQRVVVNKKTDPKVIEEENQKYIQENKDSFKKLIEAMREREGRNIKPLRPINRLSSDEEEVNKERGEKNEDPCTSKEPVEVVSLSDCSRSSSPVLDSWPAGDRPVVNGLSPVYVEEDEKVSEDPSSEDIFLPQTRQKSKTKDSNKELCDDIEETVQSDFCDAEDLFHSSPARPQSPSCIITAHSDSESENSISILIDHAIDDEFTDNVEPATEGNDAGASQLDDPDFVLNTAEEGQEESEETCEPIQRRSKRKQNNQVTEQSPRRTRRRLNK